MKQAMFACACLLAASFSVGATELRLSAAPPAGSPWEKSRKNSLTRLPRFQRVH